MGSEEKKFSPEVADATKEFVQEGGVGARIKQFTQENQSSAKPATVEPLVATVDVAGTSEDMQVDRDGPNAIASDSPQQRPLTPAQQEAQEAGRAFRASGDSANQEAPSSEPTVSNVAQEVEAVNVKNLISNFESLSQNKDTTPERREPPRRRTTPLQTDRGLETNTVGAATGTAPSTENQSQETQVASAPPINLSGNITADQGVDNQMNSGTMANDIANAAPELGAQSTVEQLSQSIDGAGNSPQQRPLTPAQQEAQEAGRAFRASGDSANQEAPSSEPTVSNVAPEVGAGRVKNLISNFEALSQNRDATPERREPRRTTPLQTDQGLEINTVGAETAAPGTAPLTENQSQETQVASAPPINLSDSINADQGVDNPMNAGTIANAAPELSTQSTVEQLSQSIDGAGNSPQQRPLTPAQQEAQEAGRAFRESTGGVRAMAEAMGKGSMRASDNIVAENVVDGVEPLSLAEQDTATIGQSAELNRPVAESQPLSQDSAQQLNINADQGVDNQMTSGTIANDIANAAPELSTQSTVEQLSQSIDVNPQQRPLTPAQQEAQEAGRAFRESTGGVRAMAEAMGKGSMRASDNIVAENVVDGVEPLSLAEQDTATIGQSAELNRPVAESQPLSQGSAQQLNIPQEPAPDYDNDLEQQGANAMGQQISAQDIPIPPPDYDENEPTQDSAQQLNIPQEPAPDYDNDLEQQGANAMGQQISAQDIPIPPPDYDENEPTQDSAQQLNIPPEPAPDYENDLEQPIAPQTFAGQATNVSSNVGSRGVDSAAGFDEVDAGSINASQAQQGKKGADVSIETGPDYELARRLCKAKAIALPKQSGGPSLVEDGDTVEITDDARISQIKARRDVAGGLSVDLSDCPDVVVDPNKLAAETPGYPVLTKLPNGAEVEVTKDKSTGSLTYDPKHGEAVSDIQRGDFKGRLVMEKGMPPRLENAAGDLPADQYESVKVMHDGKPVSLKQLYDEYKEREAAKSNAVETAGTQKPEPIYEEINDNPTRSASDAAPPVSAEDKENIYDTTAEVANTPAQTSSNDNDGYAVPNVAAGASAVTQTDQSMDLAMGDTALAAKLNCPEGKLLATPEGQKALNEFTDAIAPSASDALAPSTQVGKSAATVASNTSGKNMGR